VNLTRSFRIRREYARFSGEGYLELPGSARELRRLVGTVEVTVRSRDRGGRLRTATREFHDVELE
jgi:hypothetical protein